jgi:hypothetical protein
MNDRFADLGTVVVASKHGRKGARAGNCDRWKQMAA